MKDPDRWRARDLVRLAGGGLIGLGFIMMFPAVGVGSGASHEIGSTSAREMFLVPGWGMAALVAAALGLVVFVVGMAMPMGDD